MVIKRLSSGILISIDGRVLEIEARSPRDEDGDKLLLTCDQSSERIKKIGLDRHLRSDESLAITIDSLENPKSEIIDIAEDIGKEDGEWFYESMGRKGDKLHLYLGANLIWDDKKKIYVVQGELRHNGEEVFDIGGMPSGKIVSIKKLSDNLVERLYSRLCKDLPEVIRERAVVTFPEEGVIRPCGRGYGFFGVIAYYDGRASRGVRERSRA